MKRKNILLFLLLIAANVMYSSESPLDYSTLVNRMSSYIKKEMKKNKVMSVSIALVDGETVVWQQGFGFADKKHKIKATPRTIYPLASISKLFTGIAVMQLVEQGKINLDEPVTHYIPEFKVKERFPGSQPITIRSIMTHHSGLTDGSRYLGTEPLSPEAKKHYYDNNRILLDFFKANPPAYPVNYIHSYSNAAVALLGIVIERVSGIPFRDYCRENIFLPLHMEAASFTQIFLRDIEPSSIALPYKNYREMEKIVSHREPSGSANASCADMAQFLKMILAKGTYGKSPVIRPETLEQMLTPQNSGVALDYRLQMGLSFFLNDLTEGVRCCGHNGGLSYYNSSLKVLPDHGLGVIVLCNSPSYVMADTIAEKTLKAALESKWGIKKEVHTPQPVCLTPESMERIAGIYPNIYMGYTRVSVKRGRLKIFLYGSEFELIPYDDGWFKVKTPFPFDYLITFKEIEGRMMFAGKLGSTINVVAEKTEPSPIPAVWQERTGVYKCLTKDLSIDKNITLRVEKGFLTARFSQFNSLLLKPAANDEAIVYGLGRNGGETFYFSEEEGKYIITWKGYRFVRIG